MNGKAQTSTKEDFQGCRWMGAASQRVEVAEVSGRSSAGDCGNDPGEAGGFDRGVVSTSVRKERTTGTDRSLFIVDLKSAVCRDGEGLSDLEAAIIERYAPARESVGSESGCPGSVEEGARVYIPPREGKALLPLRAARLPR